MPRRREVEKRNIDPDRKFQRSFVTKLINVVMTMAKKLSQNILSMALSIIIEDRNKEEPIKVFKKAMENVKPS